MNARAGLQTGEVYTVNLTDRINRKAPPKVEPPRKPTWLQRATPKNLTQLVVA